jgi:hypothetical protein
MAKKQDKDKERPQDLGPAEAEDLETRIDKMLSLDEPAANEEAAAEAVLKAAKPKKIAITHHETPDEVPTAPEIETEDESEDKEDSSDEKTDVKPEDKDPEGLEEAIEETNAQLAAKVIPVSGDEPTEEEVVVELGKVASEEIIGAPEPEEQPASAEASEALPESFEDETTKQAVDDITAEESDELLDAQDEKREAQTKSTEPKHPSRLKAVLSGFLHSRLLRRLVVLLVLGAAGSAAAMPATRYYALNTAGVRSSASLRVIDESTLQPLKDVKVQLGDQSAMTDGEGNAHFAKLKLGSTGLIVQKRAFAPVNETVVLGWGSNPLGSRNIKPVGSQYTFTVTDYLSGKPLSKVAATSGDADARADEKGQIKLTLDHSGDPTVPVTLSLAGYRDEKITLDLASKQSIAVKMVPGRKAVFISKRSGTFDVYKVDVDGKNEELVLKGTGNERDDLVLLPHPTDEMVALVSTRENKRNADGYLLSTLTIINLSDNSTQTIAQSEQIKLANWIDRRLVYVQVAAGSSAESATRQRLMSYDYVVKDNRQLAAGNYFNDVITAGSRVYYAPSSSLQPNGASLFRMKPDGGSKQTLLPQETWNIFRTAYDKLVLSVPGTWYEYTLDAATPVKLEGQPASLVSRVYVDSPDGKNSLWVDTRDGKGVLLMYDVNAKSDKILRTQSGLKNPVRWLNDRTVVYRINTDQETADYAMSLDGGDPVKIRDVTNTGGIDKWYYY